MKELISDPVFENAMVLRLDQSRVKLQQLVDEWHKLDFDPVTTASQIYDLAYNPQQMIQEGKARKESAGDHLTETEKKNYLKKIRYKDPNSFTNAAARAAMDPHSERGQNLWIVKDGVVMLNKKESEKILKQRSVIARNERQVELGEKIIKIKDLFNEINQVSAGQLRLNINDLFAVDLRPGGKYVPATLNIELFRRLLNFV